MDPPLVQISVGHYPAQSLIEAGYSSGFLGDGLFGPTSLHSGQSMFGPNGVCPSNPRGGLQSKA